jgi:hypothetical protein
MRSTWRHLLRRQHGLPVALWLLLLLSANALQVVAATHWHNSAVAVAAESGSAPHAPLPDGIDHDGCLLCQVAAQAGTAAPPPAPWTLYTVLESRSASLQAIQPATPQLRPSHSWQGRAPPLA